MDANFPFRFVTRTLDDFPVRVEKSNRFSGQDSKPGRFSGHDFLVKARNGLITAWAVLGYALMFGLGLSLVAYVGYLMVATLGWWMVPFWVVSVFVMMFYVEGEE